MGTYASVKRTKSTGAIRLVLVFAARVLIVPHYLSCGHGRWRAAAGRGKSILTVTRLGLGGDAKHVRSCQRTPQGLVMAVGATCGDARVNQVQARIGQQAREAQVPLDTRQHMSSVEDVAHVILGDELCRPRRQGRIADVLQEIEAV